MNGISPYAGMQSWGYSPSMPVMPEAPVDYGLMGGMPAGAGGFQAGPGAAGYMGMPAVASPAPESGGFLSGLQGMFGGALNQYNADGKMIGQGWGMPALGVAQGLMGAFMGMKQYGLMKDQLNESKRQFNLNFDAQKNTTNASLEDRQRARVASNANQYESVGSYMDKYGVKG